MARRFLFVIDPLVNLLPAKDTSFVLMLASLARGHEVYSCEVTDLFSLGPIPHARTRRTTVARSEPHYSLYEERVEPLDWFDAIFMRKDPPVDQNYLYATLLLSLVNRTRCLVINDPRALRDANEKLYALNFPEVIPRTLVTADMARLKSFLVELGGDMIIKPLDGCGGAGVLHLRANDRNVNALLELSTQNGRRLIIGQQYIPEVRTGDKRIILVDGEPLSAMLRVPAEEELRGNIHVGGVCRATELSTDDLRIVRALGTRLHADGLFFVGIDVIGQFLTEVNVTSPTGIQEMNALYGLTLEQDVIKAVEARLATL